MAKPFYSIDEVCQKLGKDKNGVTELVREGRLREFRDAGKVFFKADEVDKLASGGSAAADDVILEAAEDSLPSVGGSGGTSIIGLLSTEDDEPKPAPAPARPSPMQSAKEGTGPGLGVVFEDDEIDIDADPMAKTQITPAGGPDRGEGSGGGSGMLELTRESDDTSLGAELLDEIYPGEDDATKKPAAAVEEAEEEAEVEEAEPAYQSAATAEPAISYAASGDPAEGMMSGLMIGALLLMVLAGSIAASAAQGFFPDYGQFLSNHFWPFLGGAVLLPVITLLIGWVIGKAGTSRRVTM